MKKLLILAGVLLNHQFYAQSYIPMLGSSNEWFELIEHESAHTERYYTRGDSTVNDKKYRILSYVNIIGMELDLGFIREDTIEKKIYMIPNNSKDTKAIIYYDFSLKEKDSIMLFDLNYDSLGYFRVDSIRNRATLAGNRRALYLNSDNWGPYDGKAIWVEEIGSLMGINKRELNYQANPIHDSFLGGLTCSFKDGIKIFQSDYYDQFDTCSIFWSNVENIYLRDEVKIYPNPASSKVYIELKYDLPFEVFIYNPFGRLIYQGINQKTIDLNPFSTGLYIIKIIINNDILTRKLFVVK